MPTGKYERPFGYGLAISEGKRRSGYRHSEAVREKIAKSLKQSIQKKKSKLPKP